MSDPLTQNIILPVGQDVTIYDMLMQPIEPELTTTGLQTLTEKYRDEQPEDTKKRRARYRAAFRAYDTAFAAWSATMAKKLRASERIARASMESLDRECENYDLLDIDSAIATV